MDPILQNIVDNHWQFFITNCSANYPLSTEFIREFHGEFDWGALSVNRKIDWSLAFFKDYLHRWDKVGIQRNPSVPWDRHWVKAYGRRADWFYLSQNPVFANDALIETFKDEINWHWLLETKALSEAQKERWAAYIPESYDPTTIEVDKTTFDYIFSEHGNGPADRSRPIASLSPEEALTWKSPLFWGRLDETYPAYTEDWIEVLLEHGEAGSARFYEEILSPRLGSDFEAIFRERMASQRRYYRIEGANHDEFGLIPGFEVPSTEDANSPVAGELGRYKEGPARYVDLPRVSGFENRLVFAADLLPLLEAHHLPPHTWIPLKMKGDTSRAGFLILRFDGEGTPGDPLVLEESYDLFAHLTQRELLPGLTTSETQFLASLRLIEALEKAQITGLSYESAAHLKIQGPEQPPVSDYELQRAQNADPRDPDYAYFEQKMERLKGQKNLLPASHTPTDDAWGRAEVRLQAEFPASFKKRHKAGATVTWDYVYLDVDDFYHLETYERNHPESYRAVVVAENGLGDGVVLLLQKRSNYKLKSTLYEANHEAGIIEKL